MTRTTIILIRYTVVIQHVPVYNSLLGGNLLHLVLLWYVVQSVGEVLFRINKFTTRVKYIEHFSFENQYTHNIGFIVFANYCFRFRKDVLYRGCVWSIISYWPTRFSPVETHSVREASNNSAMLVGKVDNFPGFEIAVSCLKQTLFLYHFPFSYLQFSYNRIMLLVKLI